MQHSSTAPGAGSDPAPAPAPSTRIAHEFARARGLHHTDVQALVAVLDGDGQGGAMTPSRLREHLNLTSGAISACLNRLEAAGHMQRERDPGDGRVVHLHYAPTGRAVAREYFQPSPTAPMPRGGASPRTSCAPWSASCGHVRRTHRAPASSVQAIRRRAH